MVPLDLYPLITQVITQLRKGETLRKACQIVGLERSTLVAHIRRHPELQAMFDDAIDEADDALAELLVDIDQVHPDSKMANVISGNIKWLLARRRPAKYGDRITVSSEGGSVDRVIVEALNEAIKRIPLPASPPPLVTIDAEYVEVLPERELTNDDLL